MAWLAFGGLLTAVMYWIAGLLFCITIIGIPFGMKHFSLAAASLFPFGQRNVRR